MAARDAGPDNLLKNSIYKLLKSNGWRCVIRVTGAVWRLQNHEAIPCAAIVSESMASSAVWETLTIPSSVSPAVRSPLPARTLPPGNAERSVPAFSNRKSVLEGGMRCAGKIQYAGRVRFPWGASCIIMIPKRVLTLERSVSWLK